MPVPFSVPVEVGVVVLTLLGAISLAMTGLSHLCVHLKLRSRRATTHHAPGISVLKPLKGIDDQLEENLASLARQEYPGPFELILGATDPEDPAMDVAVRLRRRFPEVTIKTVTGRRRPGLNPKVVNLQALVDVAEHDHILISDSNVQVAAHYLRDTAGEMADPRVGLVSNILAGSGEESLGATLENLHLNSFVAAAVCGADVLAGHPCVIGKSMLFRLSDLERIGGWRRVADVLGEDYLLGLAFARAGHRVVLCKHVIRTINTSWDIRRFASRHLRWSQMRRWIAPGAYTLEPLLNPLAWLSGLAGLVWWRGGALGVSTTGWLAGILVAVALKSTSDAILCRRLRGTWPSGLGFLAIPMKDLFVLVLWSAGWVWRKVDWRGNKFWIGPGSELYPLPVEDSVAVAPLPPADEPW